MGRAADERPATEMERPKVARDDERRNAIGSRSAWAEGIHLMRVMNDTADVERRDLRLIVRTCLDRGIE